MKKRLIIEFVILFVVIIFGIYSYFFIIYPRVENNQKKCAKEGNAIITFYDDNKHPQECCKGLESSSLMSVQVSIADKCYESGLLGGSPASVCLNCGDGICNSQKGEDVCNCPKDCKGKNKSDFSSIKEFCQSKRWTHNLLDNCRQSELPICKLCQ